MLGSIWYTTSLEVGAMTGVSWNAMSRATSEVGKYHLAPGNYFIVGIFPVRGGRDGEPGGLAHIQSPSPGLLHVDEVARRRIACLQVKPSFGVL